MSNFGINTSAGVVTLYQNLGKAVNDYIKDVIIEDAGYVYIAKLNQDGSMLQIGGFENVPTESKVTREGHKLKYLVKDFKEQRFIHYFLNKPVTFYVKEAEIEHIQKLAYELAIRSNIKHQCCLLEYEHQGYTYFIILSTEAFSFYKTQNGRAGELVLMNDNKWVVGRSDKPLELEKKALQNRVYKV